ncbi:MAG: VWA domain-containing protein [Ruminiclostridium sp.]|nr:VWA domain-containing protein [Ruminiclostridium sp.]
MNALELKNPTNLIYIILPLAALVLFFLGRRKKIKILEQLRINTRERFLWLRIACIVLGLGLIFFSLLGPQVFEGFTEVEKTGLDIYVLIDTSKSMLTEDIKPNRLNRAQKIIESILDNLDGDRIGFIPYSSSAYIQMPLTDDYDLAKMFLEVIDTELIGGGGTNVGTAISLANASFDRATGSDRVILIFSDGEEYETNSIETLKRISDNSLRVYTVGIGTEKGGLIPVYDESNSFKVEYKKDLSGEHVLSKLDSDALQQLAVLGKGKYFQSTLTGEEISSLVQEIAALKRNAYKTDKIRRFKQLYQYFLGAGLILFLAAWLLPERRVQE